MTRLELREPINSEEKPPREKRSAAELGIRGEKKNQKSICSFSRGGKGTRNEK